MQLPVEYMVKISVFLAVTYTFYYLLLKHITHYAWNRWFLLTCTILSFIVPAININLFVQQGQLGHIYFISKVPVIYSGSGATGAAQAASLFTVQNIASVIFVGGILLLMARLAIQYLSLKKLQATAKLVSNGDGDIKLYHLDSGIAPFSFSNSIYCNKEMYNQQELEEVIRHELVHVRQKHTVDVLVAELLCILNWYNPFAWMIKAAIKENLEFIADDKVLQHGVSKQGYQYLILKVTGNMPYAIANSFNFSSLKKRIAMMNKNRTSKLHLLKFVFMVPLACILLLAFRQGYDKKTTGSMQAKTEAPADETFTLGALTYQISDPVVESIIKKDRDNSYLKPGEVLSLSSMKNEKYRLAGLLTKSGYDTSGSHAIYFIVDTFSTSKSFSIQININVTPAKKISRAVNRVTPKAEVTGYEDHNRLKSNVMVTAQVATSSYTQAANQQIPAAGVPNNTAACA